MSVIGDIIGAFSGAVDIHNATCDSPAHGIGMAAFRMERIGLEEGEEILPGVKMTADGGPADSFRVLCDGQHEPEQENEAQEPVKAVSGYSRRSDPVYV